MPILTISETQDFTSSWLFHIDTIEFINPAGSHATGIFENRQFSKLEISPAVMIDGSAGRNSIEVHADYRGFNASGWTFADWSNTDRIVIMGSAVGERLTGSSQRDVISGGAGSDVIRSGGGNDVVSGGPGFDNMNGGTGADTLDYGASPAAVRIDLANRTAFGGDATGDRIKSFEHVIGSDFNDNLTGNGVSNRLFGGLGADRLEGGGGSDRFIFRSIEESYVSAGHDRILDFSHAENDRIRLSGVDAVFGGGDDSFTFVGTAAFTEAGQLRYVFAGSQTLVQGDIDGDTIADFEIALDGVHHLVAADFIL